MPLMVLWYHQLFRHIIINKFPFTNMFLLLITLGSPYLITKCAPLLIFCMLIWTLWIETWVELARDADMLEFAVCSGAVLAKPAQWC